MRMPVYLYLSSPCPPKCRAKWSSLGIYSINRQSNVYSYIDQSYFFFVTSFHVLLPFCHWSISLFFIDFFTAMQILPLLNLLMAIFFKAVDCLWSNLWLIWEVELFSFYAQIYQFYLWWFLPLASYFKSLFLLFLPQGYIDNKQCFF